MPEEFSESDKIDVGKKEKIEGRLKKKPAFCLSATDYQQTRKMQRGIT